MRLLVSALTAAVLLAALATDAAAQARGRMVTHRPMPVSSVAARPATGFVSFYPATTGYSSGYRPATGGRLSIHSAGPAPFSVGQGQWVPQDAQVPSDWGWKRVDLAALVNEVSRKQTQ